MRKKIITSDVSDHLPTESQQTMVDDMETPKKFIIKNIQASKHSKQVNQLAAAK